MPWILCFKVVELADRLLDEVPNCCTTVYLIDSWIRDAVATPADQQPALFYLGEGKTAVQVFRTDAVRPEAPRFQDLQTLPARTRTAVQCTIYVQICGRMTNYVQKQTFI